jgi:hypothetical protein
MHIGRVSTKRAHSRKKTQCNVLKYHILQLYGDGLFPYLCLLSFWQPLINSHIFSWMYG